MKVAIKSFDVAMKVKNKGVELEIKDTTGKKHLGDCYVTMAGLTWCKGRTKKPNGIPIKWDQLMQICKNKETLKTALNATKNNNNGKNKNK